MIFKICGLKNKESVICCEKNNVDLFGMIFYEKSPRNISFKQAENLVNLSSDLKIKPVGVFVNHNINDLKKIILSLDLKYIQLHGDENQIYIDELKNEFAIKIIKKFSLKKKQDLNKINNFNNIDYLIFDYKPEKNELPGGNSKTFDWNLLKDKTIALPWFISGGINETNIKKIQKLINPNGIDLSSGVEQSKGIKSNQKINNLFKVFYDN
ncbi:MAG: phosphoribosylanthranilate isomerase [Pelagibacteraceae bacterium]|jgi:phosphoribosylanthranilate isomerase|nr:phosphoribosylanthranilate isomerase [Pelagibacteraceae bacterium]MBT4645290.1 phosphoribosylanthranilate isomerase [Pelagibacteraceae bacterium]MBT4950295.1 phosphoribosylanthranilate isomerase [Pelagibacteraceae bacterium]MBT5213331.1 phosphoribosylanthranilate isomerase [Pelagibacteraceae bacterium]MBT6354660.1 phosphoribosylanthranilate isomerase [Pelagibacteraceae bacterium]